MTPPPVSRAPKASAQPARPCPICGKPQDGRFRPFCSRRCADLDLGHWLQERYRIPSTETGEEDETDEAAGDDEPQSA